MEQQYWFVAQTHVFLNRADVSYFMYRDGLYRTGNIDSEYICYFSTEEAAKSFAYDGIANTDRTVHARYLSFVPKNLN